jgi:hypothetical protein
MGCHIGCAYRRVEAHRAKNPKHKQSLPHCLASTIVSKPKGISTTQNICRNAQAIQQRHASSQQAAHRAPTQHQHQHAAMAASRHDSIQTNNISLQGVMVSWYSMSCFALSTHTLGAHITPQHASLSRPDITAKHARGQCLHLKQFACLSCHDSRQHQKVATPQCIIFTHLTACSAGTACPRHLSVKTPVGVRTGHPLLVMATCHHQCCLHDMPTPAWRKA